MKELFIGDYHAGHNRQIGTTLQSVYDMEADKFDKLDSVITDIAPDIVYFLGDMFDKVMVDDKYKLWLIELFKALSIPIYCLRGNHDSKSTRYDNICSLEMIGGVLENFWVVYYGPERKFDNYLVPHAFDQDTFDTYIESVPDNTTVLIHANIMSGFAEGDQSLNLDRDQITKLINKGCDIIAGHEHSHCRMFKDKVKILGAFQPTNIHDCETDKYVMVRENGKDEFIKVWDKSEEYIKVDWTNVDQIDNQSIIEVTGEVSIDESVEANKVVAELRKISASYIVKNSVKVKNRDLDITSEDVTNFNIVDIFKKSLDEETRRVVDELSI